MGEIMNKKISQKLSTLVSQKDSESLDSILQKTSEFSKTLDISESRAKIYLANEFKKAGDYTNAKKLYEKLLQQITVMHSGSVNKAIYNPSGDKILSASHDKTIKEWDVRTGQCLRIFSGHSGSVNSAVYNLIRR